MSDLFGNASGPVKAEHVVAMLQRHYLPEGRPPGGVLAVEIGAPDGTRRADAVWAPLTLSGGDLVGHEIKVTRSDVMTELADPTKADPWLQFCSRWWLTVADPALVTGLDIPEAWGIMAPPSGRRTRSMTVIRPAPLRKVGDTGPAWRRLLSWHCHHTAESSMRTEASLRYRTQEVERLQAELSDRRLAGEGRAHPHAKRIAAILQAVEHAKYDSGPGGVWMYDGDITDDDIVAAILDVGTARAMARDVRWRLDRLVDAAAQFRDPMADVAKNLAALRAEVEA